MDKHLRVLNDEIKNRALIYHEMYQELATELGPGEAIRLLGNAIYHRGENKGRRLAEKIGRADLAQLAREFVEGKNEMDAFGHQIVEVTGTHALLRLNRCPLSEAWKEAGLSAGEKTTMCDIASRVDFGKFEGAGYRLKFDCRIADGAGTCDLRVTKA